MINPAIRKIGMLLLVLVALVLIWRGVWGLADLYLFSSDLTASLILSIIFGLAILALFGKKVFKLLL